MKRLIVAIGLTGSMIALANIHAEEVAEKLELTGGRMLFLHPDGTGRMVDAHGKSMDMSDGKEMALKDGRVVIMKNKKVWVRIGSPGSGQQVLRND